MIAIDGTAASGKGTIARLLANKFRLNYLDTGKIYRYIAFVALENNIYPTDIRSLIEISNNIDIFKLKSPELITQNISRITPLYAQNPEVRYAILKFQREFARRAPGSVLDGRDIGTVVLPDADVKIFVDAEPRVRAQRRAKELRLMGADVTDDEILRDLVERDKADRERSSAPLLKAPDAILIDTSNLDVQAAFDVAKQIVEAKMLYQTGLGR